MSGAKAPILALIRFSTNAMNRVGVSPAAVVGVGVSPWRL